MELLKLRTDQVQVVSFPMFHCKMTGVFGVQIDKKLKVTLTYEDKTQEFAIVTKEQWEKFDSLFNIVSTIQSIARK